YYGFRTFSHLLEDAQRRGIVQLRRDQKSGSYIVEDLGSPSSVSAAARPEVPSRQEALPPARPEVAAAASPAVHAPRPEAPPAPPATVAAEPAESANGPRPARR